MSVYMTAFEYARQSPVEVGYLGPVSMWINMADVRPIRGRIIGWRDDPMPDPCADDSAGHCLVAEVVWAHSMVSAFWPATILRKDGP